MLITSLPLRQQPRFQVSTTRSKIDRKIVGNETRAKKNQMATRWKDKNHYCLLLILFRRNCIPLLFRCGAFIRARLHLCETSATFKCFFQNISFLSNLAPVSTPRYNFALKITHCNHQQHREGATIKTDSLKNRHRFFESGAIISLIICIIISLPLVSYCIYFSLGYIFSLLWFFFLVWFGLKKNDYSLLFYFQTWWVYEEVVWHVARRVNIAPFTGFTPI